MLQRVGLDGRCRVIQSVRVVCWLSRQRARVGQRPRSTVTEKPEDNITRDLSINLRDIQVQELLALPETDAFFVNI